MKKEDFDAVKAQIALYKEWRKVLQTGSFYRGIFRIRAAPAVCQARRPEISRSGRVYQKTGKKRLAF